VVPVVYTFVDDFAGWFGERAMKYTKSAAEYEEYMAKRRGRTPSHPEGSPAPPAGGDPEDPAGKRTVDARQATAQR
jgi:hypothetical protein